MTARATAAGLLAGFVLLAVVAGGVLLFRGDQPGAAAGIALGVLLGAGGSALEAALVRRALLKPRGPALGIVLGGFLLRLVVLAAVTFALDATGLADAASFALCFLGGFLASLPVLAAAVAGDGAAKPGEVRG
jgi:hypothetical protein